MLSRLMHFYYLVAAILFTAIAIVGTFRGTYQVSVLSAVLGGMIWLEYFYPKKY